MISIVATRPWQKVGLDLFHYNGKNFILAVDYFSGFIEMKKLQSTNSNDVTNFLSEIFSRFGLPETVISDNGP